MTKLRYSIFDIRHSIFGIRHSVFDIQGERSVFGVGSMKYSVLSIKTKKLKLSPLSFWKLSFLRSRISTSQMTIGFKCRLETCKENSVFHTSLNHYLLVAVGLKGGMKH